MVARSIIDELYRLTPHREVQATAWRELAGRAGRWAGTCWTGPTATRFSITARSFRRRLRRLMPLLGSPRGRTSGRLAATPSRQHEAQRIGGPVTGYWSPYTATPLCIRAVGSWGSIFLFLLAVEFCHTGYQENGFSERASKRRTPSLPQRGALISRVCRNASATCHTKACSWLRWPP